MVNWWNGKHDVSGVRNVRKRSIHVALTTLTFAPNTRQHWHCRMCAPSARNVFRPNAKYKSTRVPIYRPICVWYIRVRFVIRNSVNRSMCRHTFEPFILVIVRSYAKSAVNRLPQRYSRREFWILSLGTNSSSHLQGALKEHQITHSEERPFQCRYCPKKFKNMPRLKVRLSVFFVLFSILHCQTTQFVRYWPHNYVYKC